MLAAVEASDADESTSKSWNKPQFFCKLPRSFQPIWEIVGRQWVGLHQVAAELHRDAHVHHHVHQWDRVQAGWRKEMKYKVREFSYYRIPQPVAMVD